MKETKRPALLAGLVITTFEIVLFIISFLLSKNSDIVEKIIFAVFVVTLIINTKSFYTVNLSAKEFKKKRYLPWLSFTLITIYNCYSLAIVIVNTRNGMSPMDLVMVGNLIILFLASLLYIPGILKRIIDNKITYEEHVKQTKSKQ